MPADLDQLHRKARRLVEGQLSDGEDVVAVLPGRSRQAMIVTDRRLVMAKPGIMSGLWLGRKAASFRLDSIAAINVHAGRGITALEVVLDGQSPHPKPDLAAAFQEPNWLPCEASMARSPLIAALRGYVESDGRDQSARAELREAQR